MQPATSLTEIDFADQENPWDFLPATEQPAWRHHPEYNRCRRELQVAPPLVTESETEDALRAIAKVAAGSARMLQVGDCAESFDESGSAATAAKVDVITELAEHLSWRVAQETVRFGRMAGQYAKPRSNSLEVVDGVEMPVFRGHLVNAPEPNVVARHCDPRRLLRAHAASAEVLDGLRTHWQNPGTPGHNGPWTSHEALVMDYESPQVRTGATTGARYLSSTHFPWIGERTRQLDHAQVRLLASVSNPVACKVGPTVDPATVVRLCGLLDPDRTPGRLTLIIRMGRSAVAEALAPVVRAVHRAGHPVVWLSDPMHGNTVRAKTGKKTRYLDAMIDEAVQFRSTLDSLGRHPGGVHLEVAATEVTECVGGPVADENALEAHYESLCDPRLSPEQAHEFIESVF
jgi:3-deoxy-7-phosphoheptulonate synthase